MQTRLTLCSFFFLLPLLVLHANPPDPEDVLDPTPDPGSWYFLQPYVGLGYSFLTTSPARPLGSAEDSNSVIESGSGLGLDIGIDLGYVVSEHFATRVGLFYTSKSVSNSGIALGKCSTPLGDISQEVETDYCLGGHYLGLSIQADLRFSDFFGYIGVASAMPLQVSYEETDKVSGTDSICYYFADGPEATGEITGEYTDSPILDNLRHTLRIGGGYLHALGDETDLVIQLQYEHPLSNFLSSNGVVNLQNPEFSDRRQIPVEINGASRFGTLYATLGLRFNHIF